VSLAAVSVAAVSLAASLIASLALLLGVSFGVSSDVPLGVSLGLSLTASLVMSLAVFSAAFLAGSWAASLTALLGVSLAVLLGVSVAASLAGYHHAESSVRCFGVFARAVSSAESLALVVFGSLAVLLTVQSLAKSASAFYSLFNCLGIRFWPSWRLHRACSYGCWATNSTGIKLA
jgi:hypothetical protein